MRAYHLPNLKNVVLGHRGDNPRVILVPREVADLRRVASVNELRAERGLKKAGPAALGARPPHLPLIAPPPHG
jgi:hypothetical protein